MGTKRKQAIKTYDKGYAEIQPFPNSLTTIDVYFPSESCLGKRVGGVNWSAMGTKSIKDTKLFIKALQKAVKLLEEAK